MLAIGNVQQAGSNNTWIWYLLSVLLVALVLWWWFSRRGAEPAEAAQEAPAGVREDRGPDDLTRIEGIGRKVAGVLKGAGITTFDALARANAADVRKTLNDFRLQMMNPEGWIEQASLAAKGDWAGLEKLQSELKGGRRS